MSGDLSHIVMRCEEHPDLEWPHDDCPGPGVLTYQPTLAAYSDFITRHLDDIRRCFDPSHQEDVCITLLIRLPWLGAGKGIWVISDDEVDDVIRAIGAVAASDRVHAPDPNFN